MTSSVLWRVTLDGVTGVSAEESRRASAGSRLSWVAPQLGRFRECVGRRARADVVDSLAIGSCILAVEGVLPWLARVRRV